MKHYSLEQAIELIELVKNVNVQGIIRISDTSFHYSISKFVTPSYYFDCLPNQRILDEHKAQLETNYNHQPEY